MAALSVLIQSLSRRRARSVRFNLMFIVLACVVPLTVMAAALIYVDYQRERENITNMALGRTHALTASLDRELAALELSLQVLAISTSLERDDLQAFQLRATKALSFLGVTNCVLLDPSGAQRMNTLVPFGDPLPRVGGPPELQRIFKTDAAVYSDLFIGPVTKKPTIALGVPVHRNGQLVYSLNAGIFPERIAALLQRQQNPPSWIAVIFDSTGTIVSRTHAMDRFVGKKAMPQLVSAASQSNEGRFESVTLEGIPVMTTFSRSTASKWTVAIGIPLEDLTAGLRTRVAALIALTLLTLLCGLSAAWFVGGRVARSISVLLEPAKALGTGAIADIPTLYFREANEFSRSLVEASNALHQAKHDAHHDLLSGLANRALFKQFVRQQIMLCQRTQTTLAILYVDLDGFKAINDTYGHATGDVLLREVAVRIKTACRESDVAARLGGDEFALCLIHTDLSSASSFAGKLIEALSAVYVLEALVIDTVSASIGIAGYPTSANDPESLVKAADEALYRAKASGKHCYVVAAAYLTEPSAAQNALTP